LNRKRHIKAYSTLPNSIAGLMGLHRLLIRKEAVQPTPKGMGGKGEKRRNVDPTVKIY